MIERSMPTLLSHNVINNQFHKDQYLMIDTDIR